jgi:uncharacterized OB-fold protein
VIHDSQLPPSNRLDKFTNRLKDSTPQQKPQRCPVCGRKVFMPCYYCALTKRGNPDAAVTLTVMSEAEKPDGIFWQ